MTVTLRAKSSMAGVVLDRFGLDVIMVPDGPDYFTVSIPLVLSPQFLPVGLNCPGGGRQSDVRLQCKEPPEKLRSALEQA